MKQTAKTKIFTIFFGIFLVLLPFGGLVLAAAAEENSTEVLKEKFTKGTVLLRKIDSSLKAQEGSLQNIRSNVRDVKKRLKATTERVQTLKEQLSNIQQVRKESEQKLLSMKRQMAERENELLLLREQLARKRLEKQQLYQQIQVLSRFQASGTHDDGLASLSVLLAFNDLGEGLAQGYFSDLVKNYAGDLFREADRMERETMLATAQLHGKNRTLAYLQSRVEAEIRNIEFHKQAKKNLLKLTKGQETIYEQLLEESKKEEDEVNSVIEHLHGNFDFIKNKLDALKEEGAINEEISLEDLEGALGQLNFDTNAPFRWAVPPLRGISAYFHDEEYKASLGIPHNAIDIRVPQETNVRAAATGVVYKVRDEDTGYNYLILAHRDGFLTLYGHLTRIDAKEGDTVFSGQTVGLSGGIPGTRGAGWLTTGAHLHFEVFKDWKHVDPLEYLPLEYLPIEYVPQEYLSELSDIGKKVPRVAKKKIRRTSED